ncbi:MAG: hypothetical protein LBF60_03250 [Treponema sp.]|nr:hypothetical protein [Treponema sp.]
MSKRRPQDKDENSRLSHHAGNQKKLLAISPPAIDRLLKAEKDALRGKGVSGSKLGEAALLKQIPVRTRYNGTERNTLRFIQTDTAGL